LACRLGDLVAFNGLKEVPEFKEVSFESLGELSFIIPKAISKIQTLAK